MLRRCLAMALVIGSAAVCAAPQDDFEKARKAYAAGDVSTAMRTLRPAAEAGHGPSMALLAWLLERSDFVDEAVVLYRRAAALDVADAHVGLGNLYLAGRGVAKDEKAAISHFSKAAQLGDAHAAVLVARLQKGSS